jgi:sortase A
MTIHDLQNGQAEPNPQFAPRRSTGWRRPLRLAGLTLFWSGMLILAFLAYQLWGTSLYNRGAQEELAGQLAARLAPATTAITTTTQPPVELSAPSQPPATVAAPTEIIVEQAPSEGQAVGRIVIPAAAVDAIMVEGVERDVLKKGPGHMPWTPLPGQPGNSVLSGHRTTYGAPFFYLDQVKAGDDIHIDTSIGRHTYRVREILVVEPTDVWVTESREGAWLTLTTCTPRYSAAQRLVIVSELVAGPNLAAIGADTDDQVRKAAA